MAHIDELARLPTTLTNCMDKRLTACKMMCLNEEQASSLMNDISYVKRIE
ncbi:hypothetical protein [Moraxella caprae]|nr:hypothetical protein [Moraxella caprae]